ncbi:hypothetical protein [Paenibacillus campi]|uniref:hypothetical protein n=1 Tax=Paenibacillus campi TaxID=3106031 RepID=UPI002AFE8908|nr:hypothetical protein [Paenibacillus sp. SGZ-1009]
MERLMQANVHGSKQIVLSEHVNGQDLITRNSIDIEIVNVSSVQTAFFVNQLPTGAAVPDIDVEQDQVSVIYIHFLIGTGEAYLTESKWAEGMECHAPYDWKMEKVIDSEQYGVYFKLYPLKDIGLEPRNKIYFSLTNLVSFGQSSKMVYVAVRFGDVLMESMDVVEDEEQQQIISADGTDFLAYFKTSPLRIVHLQCDRTRVAVGDKVNVSWAVAGKASKCVLTPGDLVVERVGSMEIEVFDDTTFQLYVFDDDKQLSETTTVYVDAATISAFTCDLPDLKAVYGQHITLLYEVKNAVNVYLNEGIGRLTAQQRAVRVTPSQASTTYQLSCMGAKGLVQKELTVVLTDLLELLSYVFNRIKRADGSYSYTLQWVVAHCTSIQVTTSDGVEHSHGQAQGTVNFTNASATPLSFTLDCTGSSGQTIHKQYFANA